MRNKKPYMPIREENFNSRFAVYYTEAGSEKPWNLGLRGMSATVTGLSVGTPYTFYVAMSQTRGWGPRSQGLAVTTTATCASPTDQSECTGIAMGAPLVSPLNCVAMLLEVPSGGPCFSSGREVVGQMPGATSAPAQSSLATSTRSKRASSALSCAEWASPTGWDSPRPHW